MPRALFSVSDKIGLVGLGCGLADLGWTLIASGGTAQTLRAAGLSVTDVADVTGSPEMLGGRVKTLHPAIHAGILARATDADLDELATYGVQPIDLVVCNLYPFRETVQAGVSLAGAVEQIDIGGVTLLRAAAKNLERVTVLCDPGDYEPLLAELRTAGATSAETRYRLAVKAFAHTRDYDTAVEAYLRQAQVQPSSLPALSLPALSSQPPASTLPKTLYLSLPLAQEMRYGENPHQAAGLYAAGRRPPGRPIAPGQTSQLQ